MSMAERVLCIPSRKLEPVAFGSYGPKSNHKSFLPAGKVPIEGIIGLLHDSHWEFDDFFVPREKCEKDGSLRQLCSYCVFNAAGMNASYTRSKEGAEGRLYGKRSLGFGGHINIDDFPDKKFTPNSILEAVSRENREEIEFSDRATYHYVGMIIMNESDNPVDLVHAGLVYEISLPSNDLYVAAKEPCIADILTSTRSFMLERYPREKFENWSQVLLDAMAEPRQTFF